MDTKTKTTEEEKSTGGETTPTPKKEDTVSKVEYDKLKAELEKTKTDYNNIASQNQELQKRLNNTVELLNTVLDKYIAK